MGFERQTWSQPYADPIGFKHVSNPIIDPLNICIRSTYVICAFICLRTAKLQKA